MDRYVKAAEACFVGFTKEGYAGYSPYYIGHEFGHGGPHMDRFVALFGDPDTDTFDEGPYEEAGVLAILIFGEIEAESHA